MTGHSLRVRFTLALVLGGLLMSVMASPASASHRTRWVDDDNKNGDGPKACNTAGFSTIQAAINASHAWDRVFVCPGNYAEEITIDVTGLEVRSVVALAAKLWPPDELFGPALVTLDAPYATLRGFRMNIPAGDVIVTGIPTACENVEVAILALAPAVNILGNHIKAKGDYTFIGECGYDIGIVIADGAENEFGPSMVWRNWIRDFKFAGILVEPLSSAKIFYNAIRYVHLNDPTTCQMVPVLGALPSAVFPDCPYFEAFRGTGVEPQNGFFTESVGILVEFAKAIVKGNSIYSQLDTSVLTGPIPVTLFAGIVMLEAWDNSKVNVNRVDNVGVGVVIAEEGISFPEPVGPTAKLPEAPDGVAVNGNRVSETIVAFLTEADDGVYFGNRAHLNLLGMTVLGGEDNVFVRNDFRFNVIYDCLDETLGGGTLGTANDWDEINLGFYNSPEDLCYEFFAAPV